MDGILRRRVDLLPMIFHLKLSFTFFLLPMIFHLKLWFTFFLLPMIFHLKLSFTFFLLPMIFHLKLSFTFFTLHVFFLISFVCLHFWVGCAKVLIIFWFRLSMGLPMWWNSIVKKELKWFFFSSNLLEFLFGLKITHTSLSDMIMISERLIIYHFLYLQSCAMMW
jgi:hypothetical protein